MGFCKVYMKQVTNKTNRLVDKTFFSIRHTVPHAKDEMVVCDSVRKKRLRKYYLTMYLRDILKKYDMSKNNQCWLSECDLCKDDQKFKPQKPMDVTVNDKQWKSIHTPLNSRQHKRNMRISPNFFLKAFKSQVKQCLLAKCSVNLSKSFEDVISHINVKQIQAKAFQDNLTEPNSRVLQIDYAMAYQNEIQSALWSRESFNLFTCAIFHQSITKTLLICTNFKGKDKFANGKFLKPLYAHEIPQSKT